MPTTQVSHTTVRSVSIVNSEKDAPPEKYLRLMARHEYRYIFYLIQSNTNPSAQNVRDLGMLQQSNSCSIIICLIQKKK